MAFHNPSSTLFIPDSLPQDVAWSRVTHLGVGAHHDDLEFMAFHGIVACFDHAGGNWFGGGTCTDAGVSVWYSPIQKPSAGYLGYEYGHGGGFNILCLDGHVRYVLPQLLIQASLLNHQPTMHLNLNWTTTDNY